MKSEKFYRSFYLFFAVFFLIFAFFLTFLSAVTNLFYYLCAFLILSRFSTLNVLPKQTTFLRTLLTLPFTVKRTLIVSLILTASQLIFFPLFSQKMRWASSTN